MNLHRELIGALTLLWLFQTPPPTALLTPTPTPTAVPTTIRAINHLDPDLRPLIQTRHTPTQVVLVTLHAHRPLLLFHGVLARPNRALRVAALALEDAGMAGCLCGCEACFDIGIVGGVDHIDVLLGFRFLGFEGISRGSGVVEW